MARRSRIGGAEAEARRTLRCAIYTRKSSEEGLEQSFNSLHAQRDACEAFIASQKHEGWVPLPTAYDDGGLSGGSMVRPALQQLLNDIRSRLIDVVIVYKVDRLTRSLADFAKLTELFDQNDVSFVSVTQQFNTSTSMGRLTLNVLLSFAQFEREVAGERIRDKIALSKRRGMWMGGLPPLGYDGIDRQLVINRDEAETVRLIYRRYVELGSVAALTRSLDDDGVVSKRRRFKDGQMVGGVPLSRGAIYQILRNRLYRGEIEHRGEIHVGNHQPIIDQDLWRSVQDRLTGQSGRKRGKSGARMDPALLAGRAFDGSGSRLTPSYAVKAGRRYRYYVSAPLVRGTAQKGLRIPAPDLECLVIDTIATHLRDPQWVTGQFASELDIAGVERVIDAAARLGQSIGHASNATDLQLIDRVVVDESEVSIRLCVTALAEALSDAADGATLALRSENPIDLVVPARALRRGKQVRLVIGMAEGVSRSPDSALLALISDAYRWFDELRHGRVGTIAQIAKRERIQASYVSRMIGFAFLAPDIVEMILVGSQPPSLTAERLKAARPLPKDWDEQRALLLS